MFGRTLAPLLLTLVASLAFAGNGHSNGNGNGNCKTALQLALDFGEKVDDQKDNLTLEYDFFHESAEADIPKTVEIDGIPYGLRAVHHQRNTNIQVHNLRRIPSLLTTLAFEGRSIDVSFTKLAGKFAVVTAVRYRDGSIDIIAKDLEGNVLSDSISIPENISGIQFLREIGRRQIGAAFAPGSQRIYVFDLVTGDMASTKMPYEKGPGWTGIFSPGRVTLDRIEIRIDRVITLDPASGHILTEDFRFMVPRRRMMKADVIIGLAPTSLLDATESENTNVLHPLGFFMMGGEQ